MRKWRSSTLAMAAALLFAFVPVAMGDGANKTWDGEGLDGSWGTAANWNLNTEPDWVNGDNIYFGTGAVGGVFGDTTLGADRKIDSLTIRTDLAGSIDGGTITIDTGAITRVDTAGTEADHVISAGLILGAAGAWTINGSGMLEVSGPISGSFGMTKTGAGTLRLSSDLSDYGGTTVLQQGVLEVGADYGLGSSALNVAANGVIVRLIADEVSSTERIVGNDITLSANLIVEGIDLISEGTVTMTGARALQIDNAVTELSGPVVGTGFALTKTGDGTLIFSGFDDNSHGSTAVNAGTLVLDKSNDRIAIPGALTISGASTTVRLDQPNQIAQVAVTVQGGSTLDFNSQTNGAFTTLTVTNSAVENAAHLTTNGDMWLTNASVEADEVTVGAGLTLNNSSLTADTLTLTNATGGSITVSTPSTLDLGRINMAPTQGQWTESPHTNVFSIADMSAGIDLDLSVPLHGGMLQISPGAGQITVLLGDTGNPEQNDFQGGLFIEDSPRMGPGRATEWVHSTTGLRLGVGGDLTVLVGEDNALGAGDLHFGINSGGSNVMAVAPHGGDRTIGNPQVILGCAHSRFLTEDGDLTITGRITDWWGTIETGTIGEILNYGGFEKYGSKSLILTGMESDYWNDTEIVEGRVVLNGKHNAFAVPNTTATEFGSALGGMGGKWLVHDGATVAGTGIFEGKWVEIYDGGHLQPGHDGIGTLTIAPYTYWVNWAQTIQRTEGKLFLNPLSNLDFELGAITRTADPGVSDKFVTYDLQLDGRLNVSDASATVKMEPGNYVIMTYSHDLTTNNGEAVAAALELYDIDCLDRLVKGVPMGDYYMAMNSSIEVNETTKEVLVKIRAHAGDANSDGQVDVGDLGILAANYGGTVDKKWAKGDFNLDGIVSVGDLGILAANYGWVWVPPSVPGGSMPAAVPEPATIGLLVLGSLGALLRKRR